MIADPETANEIEELIHETYRRMSTPGADPGALFAHEDMAVAGSGQGELMDGPDVVGDVARMIASQGFTWTAEQIRIWREGDVAWAQILGHVVTRRDGQQETVPYWTTGVFAREAGAWHWRYWGGAEPQAEPRV
ncbi:MAG TPA: nuclear transport factor 2 family protein [Candidatus Limnocylindrales bacterium]|nr:nuclear transport factor 2 family protein [Candidatus Limnocylindrales bacterium]